MPNKVLNLHYGRLKGSKGDSKHLNIAYEIPDLRLKFWVEAFLKDDECPSYMNSPY